MSGDKNPPCTKHKTDEKNRNGTNHFTVGAAGVSEFPVSLVNTMRMALPVTASTVTFASLPQSFVAAARTPALNLTLAPAGWVAGTTYVFGTPQPFATLSFQSASNRTRAVSRPARRARAVATARRFLKAPAASPGRGSGAALHRRYPRVRPI